MKTYFQATVKFDLSQEELSAINKTLEVLGKIQDVVPEGTRIISSMTGEIIDGNELPRIGGILDGLRTNDCVCWEIER